MRLTSTILAALSTVLMLAAVFYWIRSYSYYEGIVYYSPSGKALATATEPSSGKTAEVEVQGKNIGLLSARGKTTLALVSDPTAEPTWQSWSHGFPANTSTAPRRPNRLVDPIPDQLHSGVMSLMAESMDPGFTIGSSMTTKFSDRMLFDWQLPYWRLTLPHWFLVAMFAILPWRWTSNYLLLAKREREGRCLNCGAELAGKTTGPCPNCKREIEK